MNDSVDAPHPSTPEPPVHAEHDPSLPRRPGRQAIVLLAGLAVLQLAVSWWLLTPGYFFLDEVWYHWMTRDFSATGTLELWNGYDELPSIELTHANIPVRQGRIVSRYPYPFPALAVPFYRAFGYTGLIILNSLAFVGAIILCFGIARRLFRDDNLASLSCLIFAFATFTWEYSQGAWSHITALLFLEAAFYLMILAYDRAGSRSALVWAAFSGLVAGFGPGIRIDNALALPGLLAPFLFARPWRPLEALSFILGTVPGLAVLGWTNLIKFGRFNPLDYGDGTYLSWGLPTAAAVVVAAAWTLSRPFADEFVRRRRLVLAAIGIVVLAAAFVLPSSQSLLKRGLGNFWVSVVDVRAVDPIVLAPFERSADGEKVYIGGMRRSLVQSLPYLSLLLLPVLRLYRGRPDAAATLMLLVIPLTFVAYFSLFTHGYGGLGYNFRYLIPVMPFVAILSAYALREMKIAWGHPPNLILLLVPAVFTAGAFFTSAGRPGVLPNQLEFPLLVAPLVMAGAVLCLILLGEIVTTEGARAIRGAAWVAATIAITWAGLVAFFYDFPHHRDLRIDNVRLADTALRMVPTNSLYFADPILSPSIVDNRTIRIAFPSRDRGKDFPMLLEFHLKAGRRAFAAFPADFWKSLKGGPLQDYDVIPMCLLPAGIVLGEITPPKKHGENEQKD